jgi:hypothetical protein
MDQRYAFPPVIVSLPTIAAGLCLVGAGLAEAANRARQRYRRDFSFWLLCLIVASSAVLAAMVALSAREFNYDQAEIGRWIKAKFGPKQHIALSIKEHRLVEFYAGGAFAISAPPDDSNGLDPHWKLVENSRPRAILLWLDWRLPTGRKACEHGIRKAKELGYREIPRDELPEKCTQILVLVRDDSPVEVSRP